MSAFTDESRKEIEKRLKAELAQRIDALSGRDEKLAKELAKKLGYGYSIYAEDTELAKCFEAIGSGKKPSEIFSEYSGLLEAYIPSQFREDFLYIADKTNKFQYSRNFYRRTVRSAHYERHLHTLFYMFKRGTENIWAVENADLAALYRGEADAELTDYFFAECSDGSMLSYILAARVDRGDKALEDALVDCIMAEGGQVTHALIHAAVMSDSARLHEALCKLLLAAKLQEGLRQAICESADWGTAEGFTAVFRTVCENDLVRFSSVKRAIVTWTGLGVDNAEAVDRITQKQITLINECLNDRAKRLEYIRSDDAMELYMALWAEGFHDTVSAMDMVGEIIRSGSRHQVLCASVYLNAVHWEEISDTIARKAFLRFPDDPEVLAAYNQFYLCMYGRSLYSMTNAKPDDPERKMQLCHLRLTEEQAELHYGLLWKLYDALPKKETEYKPFVFPWYSVSISRGDVAHRLCAIAYAMNDQSEIDRCCSIVQTLNGGRAQYLNLFAAAPQTDAQYSLLTACIADRESYTQQAAAKLAQNVTFRPKDYLTLEGMMKYKSGDIRSAVVGLLLKQEDEALLATVERLLTAKGEEMHLGALELIVSLSRNKERAQCFAAAKEKTALLAEPTVKEQIQLDQITGADAGAADILQQEGYGLYTADCEPKLPEIKAGQTLAEFFADCVGKIPAIVSALDKLVEENKHLEFTANSGDVKLLGTEFCLCRCSDPQKPLDRYPFADMWRSFYAEHIADEKVLALLCVICWFDSSGYYYARIDSSILFTMMFGDCELEKTYSGCLRPYIVGKIFAAMGEELASSEIGFAAAKAMMHTMLALEPEKLFPSRKRLCIDFGGVSTLYRCIRLRSSDEQARESLELMLALCRHVEDVKKVDENFPVYASILEPCECILAYHLGIIDKRYLFKLFFEKMNTRNAIEWVSRFASQKLRSWDRTRGRRDLGEKEYADALLAENSEFMARVREIYGDLLGVILPVELKRGDSDTDFSQYIHSIAQITGAENFVSILAALGKDTLNRNDSTWTRDTTKRSCLSHLLNICQPAPDDTAGKLAALLKPAKISDRRLVEAAMYAPEWIPIIGEVLGWDGFVSGCYYFIAHMKPSDKDERRNALIARFTPIAPEELAGGAFDINWFRESHDTLGEKRFSELYAAAKYISDGARHTRARKYADAIMGKFDIDVMEKEITEKRNKDTLMAYALLPLNGDTLRRYRFIQEFIRQSKNYGAQRRQSEGAAGSMALRNLASNSGYTDTMRLTLAMETELTGELAGYFEWKEIGDIRARIVVDGTGHSTLEYEKNGKALKNAPAALKKDPYLNELKNTHKALTEQYSRTRMMLEQSMEDSAQFSAAEINNLLTNPVAGPILASLVYICGEDIGLIADGIPDSGKPVRIAHTFDLYESGRWHELQAMLFERQIKQPFKQVFRELYVKTDDEREQLHSLRYAGHQIQPRRTAAALKTRRWVADYEEGLQKIFYEENIVARIYALADWFSPADIEAPTLEWVEFSDRKTGEPLRIDSIPDIIFSEVMRDVDLAVSVAHVGGVDPETSHSTIELRRAVVEFNLPLFGINNVTLTDRHALIRGERGEYSVHLGSGVIHQTGGAQIAVLPVHSQHRGRLFLPFVDDDPKTAEIMSKIVLFAEDRKIKDPSIISQIR